MFTSPSVVFCPGVEGRWVSVSPGAHVIIVKNVVSRPAPRACISTLIQVGAGGSAFHAAACSSHQEAAASRGTPQKAAPRLSTQRPEIVALLSSERGGHQLAGSPGTFAGSL